MCNLPVLNLDNAQTWRHLRAIVIVAVSFTVITLTGCGGVSEPVAVFPDPTFVPSATSTWPVPPDDATHFARATAEERVIEQIETVVALTPPPTPPTPEPARATPTFAYGSLGCSNGDNRYPDLLSCWRVILNGQPISVGSGMPGSSMDADPNQGLFLVFNGPYWDTSDPATEVYSTPLKLGGIRIVALNGSQFTVAPIDMRTPVALLTPWTASTPGTTFVFDLATRQWVNPPLTPSPSVSPLPTLTPSP